MIKPLVSIVIPCFRHGRFLTSAIRASLDQSYPNVEVIVVNDGSDDNTEEVATAFVPHIRYIAQQNKGLPGARNTGIANSNGAFLHFLDADDLLHPEAIAWLVEAIGGRERTIARMGHVGFENEDELHASKLMHPNATLELLPDLIHLNPSPPHAYLIPKSAIKDVGGFEESLRSCEDWDLWLRLAFAGYAGITVGKVGAYYRRYPGSMSTNSSRMLQTRAVVLVRAHDAIVTCPDLFGQFAEELMAAERRVYRRCLAQRVGDDYTNMLKLRIEELILRGVNLHSGILKQMMTSVFGFARAEAIAMSYFRARRPELVRSYAETFW